MLEGSLSLSVSVSLAPFLVLSLSLFFPLLFLLPSVSLALHSAFFFLSPTLIPESSSLFLPLIRLSFRLFHFFVFYAYPDPLYQLLWLFVYTISLTVFDSFEPPLDSKTLTKQQLMETRFFNFGTSFNFLAEMYDFVDGQAGDNCKTCLR